MNKTVDEIIGFCDNWIVNLGGHMSAKEANKLVGRIKRTTLKGKGLDAVISDTAKGTCPWADNVAGSKGG